MPKWTLAEGVDFVKHLECYMHPRYHVALGGSVLHKGESDNDIDILVLPHSTDHWELEEIYIRLEAAQMKLKITNEVVMKKWRDGGSTDTKYVEVWTWEHKRVDVFYPWNSRE